MKNFLTFLIILFLSYSFQSSIDFNFPRTIYMIPKIENKLINVTSSIPNNEIRLFYTHQTENFTKYCSADSDNLIVFNCVFSKYGTYKFTYEYQEEKITLDNIVQIFSSLNDIFTITKTRETSCLYKKEPFQYTLNPKKGVIVDFNNIQVYAYLKKNPIKNITEETKIILKNDSNVYTIDQELNLTKFDIVVTEIEDIKDPLGTIENISVTDIKIDNYFFPSLYLIRFEVTQCDFKPDKLILDEDLEIYCNESSQFFENSMSVLCFFENKITRYGKKKISFNNVVLKNDIFVSNSINKTKFNTEASGNGPFNFKITCPNQDFSFESISRFDYNLWDNLGVFSQKNLNSFNTTYYTLSDYSLTYQVPYSAGFNYSAIRIVRKLYDYENELNAKEYNYYFTNSQSLIYKVVLPPVFFEPDFVITGNLLERYSHRTTVLKVENYAYQFCSNYKDDKYNPPATKTFYCKWNSVSSTSAIIEDPSSFPELIMTQIRGYIGPGVLKVLRLDFYNYCQDIFGEVKNKENSLFDFYIPIGDNITVKYNGKDIGKNKNVNIKNNPFDYTFYNFIIPANKIIQGGISEIIYNGNKIENIEITYSNVLLPSLIQRIQRINLANNPSQIIIRFSEPISIGANEIRNSFYLWDGYYRHSKDYCSLQSNNLILICSNNLFEYKELYYEGKCETNIMDYHVEYYYLPGNSVYLNRKYYVLPGNKKLITFYYQISSENSDFPLKVFVNEEEVTKWETNYRTRSYYYSTNKEGDYQFSLLSKDKVLTLVDEIVYVRKSFSDFFPTFEGKKCAYYTHSITYTFTKTDIVNLNYIYCDVINYYRTLSGNSFTFDSHYYYYSKLYYRTGRFPLIIKSENDRSYPYLFKDIVTFTDVRTSRITYSFDMITIYSLCLLENLSIERYGTNTKIPLTCDISLYRYGQYYCQPNETLKYGLYRIYYNSIITDYTFISAPIQNAELTMNINETKVGKNSIKIYSDNFVLDSVHRVILKDSDAVITNFYKYYPYHKYKYVFYANTNANENYLYFDFVAHPGKSYNIQLDNGRGFSKILQLGRKIENIEFSLDKQYYVINANPGIIPSIIVQGDYALNIEYIYYRNERKREKFDLNRRMAGEVDKNIGNKKIFKFPVTKKGTYYFSYSLSNDFIKFEILDRRIIVGESIMDMVLFFPPPNTILNSKEYSIDIIPIYTFSLNVFISDSNLNPLATFTRKKGVSNYDLKYEDIGILSEGEYKFVIQEASTKELFYKQDISISNFKFEDSYYLSLGFLKIYNVNHTISDLWIYNDNEEEEFLLLENNQTLDINNKILKLTLPGKISSGYYYVDLDDEVVATIFFSKDLSDSDFIIYPISGKNNVVIKSSNYYLKYITTINLLDKNTNQIYSINSSEITFKNNDYLSFTIPNVDKNHTLILLNLTENCPHSYSSICSKTINQTLIYDKPISFTYEENYQITTNKKQKIIFNFNETLSRQRMNEFISKLYFNGELKIIDSELESCTFSNKSITCEFIYPGEFTELSINYNEFESTTKKYIYIYYFFDGESCMIEGESANSYQLDLGNNTYTVYLNNKVLLKNQTTGNYSIELSSDNYGLNKIYLQLASKKIQLYSFNYYPNFELNIEKEITTEKNGMNIGLFSNLKNINLIKKLNIYLRLPTSDEKIIVTLQCTLNNSKTICTADLSSISEGIYFIQYDNVCGRTIDLDKYKLYNKNAQKLMQIYPNFVSVSEHKDTPITLTYKNKFTEKTRPIKIAIVDKKAKKIIDNSVFDKVTYNGNTASFNLPSSLINKENIGEYKIKTIFGDENAEIVSINTLLIGNRLSLYEKKQKLIQSNNTSINIGIIFNSEISLSQISKVTYKDIELDYYIHDAENYTNILIVNTSESGINFNQTGNHSFKIYENGFDDPLTYKIEIVEKRNGENNVIINHYAYKNTEDKKAYIVVSVSDDIYSIGYTINEDINTVPFRLTALWTNSFVAKINIIEGSLTFYYNDDTNDELRKLNNNTVYVFSSIKTFIGYSFDDCQYNYCPFKNIDDNCFTFFRFDSPILDLNSKTDLYYGLYSLSTNKTTRIGSVKYSYPTISHKLSNNIYLLQVIRKDIVDDEPIVLFETNITLSNLKLNNLTYDNSLITANMTTLCHIKEHFYMPGTTFQNCKYTEEDYNLICEFSIRNKVAPKYFLYYHGEKIGNVSTLSGFVYYITTSTSNNGKGRFTIHTVNEKFGALNITKVTVTDYNNKNKIINFSGDDIIYQSNFSAYVEVAANQLSKKVYLSNITLFDGNIYNITGKDIKTIVFDKVQSVSPNYLFSYEDYDNISVQVTSDLNNIYLIHDNIENKISCSSRAKGYTCLASDIEYGLDYYINYYDNVILHTIKTSFDRKCHNSKMSNNITFTLQSEENISNIKKKFTVKLLAQSNNTEMTNRITYLKQRSENNNYFFDYTIKVNGLSEGYYIIQINNNKLTGGNILVAKGKTLKKRIGDLYSSMDTQYLIVEFKETLFKDEISRIFIQKGEHKINAYCEDLLDNTLAVLCKFTFLSGLIIENENYELGYYDKCSNGVLLGNTLVIKSSDSIPYPNQISIKHIFGSSQKQTISFDKNINNKISTISLIATSNNLNETKVSNTNEGSNTLITIPTNQKLGNYLIKITYNDNFVSIIPLVSIYDDKFDILSYKPAVAINSFSTKNFAIEFIGNYNHNQIRNVYLVYDQYYGNEQIKEINSFTFKNKKLIILEDFKVKDIEQLHFEIKGDIKTYIYYFHVINVNRYIYFDYPNLLNLNKNNLYLDFYQSDGEFTYLREVVSKISTINNIKFKFYYCYKYKCRLGRTNFNLTIGNPSQSELIFYNQKGVKLETSTDNVYIIPNKFIETYIPFKNNVGYPTFKTDGDYEYTAIFPFYNNNPQYEYYQKLLDIQTYKVLFPFTNYHYYNYFSHQNTISYRYDLYKYSLIKHSILIRNPTDNSKFITANLNPYICNEKGHIYYIIDGKVSCKACSKLYPNEPYKRDNYCVSSCYYQFKPHMQCYNSCEKKEIGITKNVYYENNKCVLECSDGYGRDFASSNKCYNCTTNKKYVSNGFCKTCEEINEPWCTAKKYFDKDIRVGSCDQYECYNGGTCDLKNFEAYCKCPKGYYGLRCELTLEQASSQAKNLVNDFLSPKEGGRIVEGDDGELIFDLDDEKNIKQIREISNLMKEPEIAKKVGRKTVKKLFHSVGTMIMKMMDGVVDLNSNILELFDLASNLVSSNLQIRGLARLRLLDDDDDDDEEINEEEEIKKLENLLQQAREIYKLITFEDIKNGIFNKNSGTADYQKSRSIYYQRWYNTEESNSEMYDSIRGNDELMTIDFSSCSSKDNEIIFISVSLSSKLRDVLEKYENKTYKITNAYTDGYDVTNGVDSATKYDLTQCKNLTAYLPINQDIIDIEKYKFYTKANINIYNVKDKAFCESCYITNGFDYDLTQKYRKLQVFDNKTIESDDCVYDSIDTDLIKMKMYCAYKESFNYLYKVVETHLDNNKTIKIDNLPLKCASYVEKLGQNIGLWVYLVLTILVIVGLVYCFKNYYDIYILKKDFNKITIIHKSTDNIPINKENCDKLDVNEKRDDLKIYRKYNDKDFMNNNGKKEEKIEETNLVIIKKNKVENNIIENKEIEENQENKDIDEIKDIEENNESINESSESSKNNESKENYKNDHPFDNFFIEEEKKEEDKEIPKEEEPKEELIEGYILEEENKESFKIILVRNIIEHYPLITFFNNTLFNPRLFNICLFAFNIVLVFGANSLFYFESIIEKRIPNNNRNEFMYPITKETLKIIISIIFSMIGMLIIRSIMIIPRIKNKKLKQFLESENEIHENKVLKGFLIRRIISCIIMLIFSVFLLYYTIVFCSLYKHTQINWIIGGIWSLLIEWVILSPLYILIISIIEKKGRSQKVSSYYMKKLFLF